MYHRNAYSSKDNILFVAVTAICDMLVICKNQPHDGDSAGGCTRRSVVTDTFNLSLKCMHLTTRLPIPRTHRSAANRELVPEIVKDLVLGRYSGSSVPGPKCLDIWCGSIICKFLVSNKDALLQDAGQWIFRPHTDRVHFVNLSQCF